MIIYFLKNENGSVLCGPFMTLQQANFAKENYYDSEYYGKCEIIEKEI